MPVDPDTFVSAIHTIPFPIWHNRTRDPLDALFAEGYFDPVASYGPRVNDLIEVVASDTDPEGATLAVVADELPAPGRLAH